MKQCNWRTIPPPETTCFTSPACNIAKPRLCRRGGTTAATGVLQPATPVTTHFATRAPAPAPRWGGCRPQGSGASTAVYYRPGPAATGGSPRTAPGTACAPSKTRPGVPPHASECGQWRIRLVKGYGKRLVFCGDLATGTELELNDALNNPEFKCPEGRF